VPTNYYTRYIWSYIISLFAIDPDDIHNQDARILPSFFSTAQSKPGYLNFSMYYVFYAVHIKC